MFGWRDKEYEKNITEFPAKNIKSVTTPKSIKELQEIVASAYKNKTDIFITSTGKNWGLGSKQPLANNSK